MSVNVTATAYSFPYYVRLFLHHPCLKNGGGGKKNFPRNRRGRMFVFTWLGCYCIWQGYNSRKEFIAAQGPLPATVKCFWRMIWEKNVQTLVMLTRCNEQGRVSSTPSTLSAGRSSLAKPRVVPEQQTFLNSNQKHIP